jgi:TniQ
MKLHLTVPLGVGETPESFTSRLAAANDLIAREFSIDWNIRFQSVVDANADAIGIIADLGGVPFVDLMRHGFVREGKLNYRHRNERLVRFSMRRSRIRVCPQCLSEDIRNNPGLEPRLAAYNRPTMPGIAGLFTE